MLVQEGRLRLAVAKRRRHLRPSTALATATTAISSVTSAAAIGGLAVTCSIAAIRVAGGAVTPLSTGPGVPGFTRCAGGGGAVFARFGLCAGLECATGAVATEAVCGSTALV